LWSNRLLPLAIGVELVLLVVFLAVAPVAGALGGSWPSVSGWALAGLAVPAVLLADALYKSAVGRRRDRHDGSG